jgi:hypothetical protein
VSTQKSIDGSDNFETNKTMLDVLFGHMKDNIVEDVGTDRAVGRFVGSHCMTLGHMNPHCFYSKEHVHAISAVNN